MKAKSVVLTSVLLAVLVAASAVVLADGPGDWVLLGKRTVTDRADHDVIVVTAARGDFRAIKLTVRRHAVEFRDVKVHFANGAVQDVEIRRVIPAGGETRVIDLVGDDRIIQRIELWYDAQSLGGKAVVRVYGRR